MSCQCTNQPEAGWSNKIHTQQNAPTIGNDLASFNFGLAVNDIPHNGDPKTQNTNASWVDVEAQAKTTSTPTKLLVDNDPEKANSVSNNASTTYSSDKSTMVGKDEKDDFPEGGLRAWLVVIGAFCGSFSVFGSK